MRLWPLLLLGLPAPLVLAQTADTIRRGGGASVRGVVHDSIAHAPLAGAAVQIVSAEPTTRFGRMATADSLGRFHFGDIPLGRYTIGFFHPVLDSLGIDAPLREVRVNDSASVHADLAVPSPARIRSAVCGGSATSIGGVIIGIVREARDSAPAAGVNVTGEWVELTIGVAGLSNRRQRLVARTGESGRFIMCNVPSEGAMMLMASRGTDSTDRIDMQIPAEAFVRRELYLASAVDVARRGTGLVTGTVIAAVGGQPLTGAQVSIGGGAQVRTNERGEWTIAGLTVGTRMLEVRAIGYYPERRPVDVGGGAPVRVELATLKSVLDTVKVTASRVRVHDLVGFQERKRTGTGTYLTPEEIERRATLNVSDVFRNLAGVKIGVAEDTLETDMTPERPQSPGPRDRLILMRGMGGKWCAPMIFLDGSPLEWLNADDIDTWVLPKDIAGIEVYQSTSTPVQYQRALNGCGAILIWKR